MLSSLRARPAGLVAVAAAVPFALAYRFALVYRVRAGYPKRHVPAPTFRAAAARFLAASLGGPLDPDTAASIAAAVHAERLPDDDRLTALDDEPGGARSIARLFRRHAPVP